MELPIRPVGDRFVPDDGFGRLVARLRGHGGAADIPTLMVSAFDHRTRMLPFIYWDKQIVPAGIRAVSAALHVSGFTSQRVVNQAWTPRVRASSARIDGRAPEMLLVSAMQIHSAPAYQLLRDGLSMEASRPLLIVGGPKAIYQPWDYFGFDEHDHSADVVCTGEEFVLLELLERLLASKHTNETMRQAFDRARSRGWLDDIPGLVFDRNPAGPDHQLVDTGVQRLVRDFDELPPPVEGYRYLERPHQSRHLRPLPIARHEVRRFSSVASLLTTRGCKFRCGYCPIPAYNQFTFRTKSPDGLVRDIAGVRRELGINLFFGTDDNFFNEESTVVATFEAMARAEFEKDDIGKPVRFGTEATEYDVHKQQHLLPLCYRGGLRAVWFGIEDMTANLVNKGQSVPKTAELFTVMRKHRILPMAMMMHYDGQPLYSKNSMDGLLNQVRALFTLGAGSVQVTVLGPASGTKDYDQVLRRGIIFKSLDGRQVEDYCWDGNHVISTGSYTPWKLQRNVLLAYASFYNPVNLARAFFRKGRKWSDMILQVWGMWALAVTAWRLLPWMNKLGAVAKGKYTVYTDVPRSRWEIVAPDHVQEHGTQKVQYVRQTVGERGEVETKHLARRASLSKY